MYEKKKKFVKLLNCLLNWQGIGNLKINFN